MIYRLLGSFVLLCLPACALVQLALPVQPANVVEVSDLNYAGTRNSRQTLNLYLPKSAPVKPLPLIVFIHGGGWSGGSKESAGAFLFPLLKDGAYVGASINYRLTDEGPHPLQIQDCKGAIRWLRMHATEYHIDKNRIAVYGHSAGAHLACLLGTSGGIKELEGTVGGNLDQSSRVTCAVSFAGPVDFLAPSVKESTVDPEDPRSYTGRLLGGRTSEHKAVARSASPVTYVTKDDAPFLLVQGSKDTLVSPKQPLEFDRVLKSAGVPSALLIGEGGGHLFFSKDIDVKVRTFMDHWLWGRSGEVSSGPVAIQ
ncbi:MAG: Carboxylesterase type [Verrucomicrobiaceae bacterium]|nr:Carboxylesterase type [Verrucomicrobiaceae bacterium]